MTKKIVVFDFDGTIVDSMNAFADIASNVLNKFFGTPLEKARQQYFETSGLPFFEQVEIIHPKDPKNKAVAEEYETIKKSHYMDHKMFPDVHDAMRLLNSKHVKSVVSSNNFQELVDALCDKLQLDFDLVLGWQNLKFHKGAPHFDFVKHKFNCQTSDLTFVGDSLKDADMARIYGVPFIAKTGIFKREDFEKFNKDMMIIDTLSNLTQFI